MRASPPSPPPPPRPASGTLKSSARQSHRRRGRRACCCAWESSGRPERTTPEDGADIRQCAPSRMTARARQYRPPNARRATTHHAIPGATLAHAAPPNGLRARARDHLRSLLRIRARARPKPLITMTGTWGREQAPRLPRDCTVSPTTSPRNRGGRAVDRGGRGRQKARSKLGPFAAPTGVGGTGAEPESGGRARGVRASPARGRLWRRAQRNGPLTRRRQGAGCANDGRAPKRTHATAAAVVAAVRRNAPAAMAAQTTSRSEPAPRRRPSGRRPRPFAAVPTTSR